MAVVKFSANLGFLWSELPVLDRVAAAGAAGFDAVEFHFPYDLDSAALAAAASRAGVQVVGLNAPIGSASGDFGLGAQIGREAEARASVEQAVHYASELGAGYVSVLAGTAVAARNREASAAAESVFRSNLAEACELAILAGLDIVIEPLSAASLENAHLRSIDAALETIESVGAPNLKLMFDCFHVQVLHGDLITRLTDCASVLGHVQIASTPDRSEPDHGDVDYLRVFDHLEALGYDGWVGAEYHPHTTTDAGLGWFHSR